MTSHAPCWIVLAPAISACSGTPDASVPARVAEGHYHCLWNGRDVPINPDFVIGPGDSFATFDPEPGFSQPGTYTYEAGVLTLKRRSALLRFRAEADRGDHSGPFREIHPEGTRGLFLCTLADPDAPIPGSLKRKAAH